jgi:5'-methylthioadenosine phosphorylase
MITDYDGWHEEFAPVEVADILAVLLDNSAKARDAVQYLAAGLTGPRAASPIDTCLDGAIITAPEARDPVLMAKLDAVAGRVLRG